MSMAFAMKVSTFLEGCTVSSDGEVGIASFSGTAYKICGIVDGWVLGIKEGPSLGILDRCDDGAVESVILGASEGIMLGPSDGMVDDSLSTAVIREVWSLVLSTGRSKHKSGKVSHQFEIKNCTMMIKSITRTCFECN